MGTATPGCGPFPHQNHRSRVEHSGSLLLRGAWLGMEARAGGGFRERRGAAPKIERRVNGWALSLPAPPQLLTAEGSRHASKGAQDDIAGRRMRAKKPCWQHRIDVEVQTSGVAGCWACCGCCVCDGLASPCRLVRDNARELHTTPAQSTLEQRCRSYWCSV